MNIEFKDKALEDLYTTGKTKDHKYKRLSPDVITRYAKVVNFLRSARRLEDLFLIKSLHYEKKEGGPPRCGCCLDNATIQTSLLFFSR